MVPELSPSKEALVSSIPRSERDEDGTRRSAGDALEAPLPTRSIKPRRGHDAISRTLEFSVSLYGIREAPNVIVGKAYLVLS